MISDRVSYSINVLLSYLEIGLMHFLRMFSYF